MFSLKNFHLVFILVAIMGADLFGGWAVHEYRVRGDVATLWLGIGCMAGGLGLAAYSIRFVRKLERMQLR